MVRSLRVERLLTCPAPRWHPRYATAACRPTTRHDAPRRTAAVCGQSSTPYRACRGRVPSSSYAGSGISGRTEMTSVPSDLIARMTAFCRMTLHARRWAGRRCGGAPAHRGVASTPILILQEAHVQCALIPSGPEALTSVGQRRIRKHGKSTFCASQAPTDLAVRLPHLLYGCSDVVPPATPRRD